MIKLLNTAVPVVGKNKCSIVETFVLGSAALCSSDPLVRLVSKGVNGFTFLQKDFILGKFTQHETIWC